MEHFIRFRCGHSYTIVLDPAEDEEQKAHEMQLGDCAPCAKWKARAARVAREMQEIQRRLFRHFTARDVEKALEEIEAVLVGMVERLDDFEAREARCKDAEAQIAAAREKEREAVHKARYGAHWVRMQAAELECAAEIDHKQPRGTLDGSLRELLDKPLQTVAANLRKLAEEFDIPFEGQDGHL